MQKKKHAKRRGQLPSLKLTFSHPKMDGWNTIVSFWDGLFSGAMVVSGRVLYTPLQIKMEPWESKKITKLKRIINYLPNLLDIV